MEDAHLRMRAKVLMRRRFRGHRAALPASAIAARSEKLCARLLDELGDAQAVALFWPIAKNNEVDLREVDAALRNRGARVAYPATDDDGGMRFLWVDDPDAMEMAPMGFRAPRADAPEARALDVIVVPGLAFDARGHRIGYGGGFYDRALAASDARTVGVAFDFQLAADIPNSDSDVAVHHVITDCRSLTTRAAL